MRMLVNKDITYWLGEDIREWFGNMVADMDDYQPTKQPMDINWARHKKRIPNWDRPPHGRWDLIAPLRGFVDKRVGCRFDEVYKEFTQRFDPDLKVGWYTLRERFNQLFASTKNNHQPKYTTADYYIDSNGYIRRTEVKCYRPGRLLHLPSSVEEWLKSI